MTVARTKDLPKADQHWSKIIETQRRKLITYLTSILNCQHLAEDALQETFIRLSHMYEPVDSVSNHSAYCYQTAKNIAIDMLRKKNKENWISIENTEYLQFIDEQENLEENYIKQKLNKRIVQAVNRLSNRHQHILSLYKRGGYKQNEIAKICAISPTLVNFTLQEVVTTCKRAITH
ncbi:DNA-directed RNA polymerase subunit sigma-70 [Pseudoalteromonas phenolica]|uniref:RNA polymerase sigma factor n=1 Tax=Pseudoalteromonas phenolica TaxID=161398 RepID=UPI00110AC4B9|nr:sigma-70 family RNA polymerase sigma factor [Pseudoalteromonas phenolica]TMN88056.1 DNA-directed RNA polymerase subunit sigma-70 [Pseudoalteromonas phenolica]